VRKLGTSDVALRCAALAGRGVGTTRFRVAPPAPSPFGNAHPSRPVGRCRSPRMRRRADRDCSKRGSGDFAMKSARIGIRRLQGKSPPLAWPRSGGAVQGRSVLAFGLWLVPIDWCGKRRDGLSLGRSKHSMASGSFGLAAERRIRMDGRRWRRGSIRHDGGVLRSPRRPIASPHPLASLPHPAFSPLHLARRGPARGSPCSRPLSHGVHACVIPGWHRLSFSPAPSRASSSQPRRPRSRPSRRPASARSRPDRTTPTSPPRVRRRQTSSSSSSARPSGLSRTSSSSSSPTTPGSRSRRPPSAPKDAPASRSSTSSASSTASRRSARSSRAHCRSA